jgi:hypothetical protein
MKRKRKYVRPQKSTKMYIYIPIISAIVLLGIWAVPGLDKFKLSVEDGVIESEIALSLPEETVAAVPEKDWQKTITWGIGALNGLFGVVLLGKKILGK